MIKNIEAVIFDMDGVLTETSEQHYIAWKALARELGVHIDREFNEKLKGISRMESLEIILEKGGLENEYTDNEKKQFANWKNDKYKELIESISENDIFAGVLPLLEALKENDIKVGLASASENAPKLLVKMGIDSYFDVIVDPKSLNNGKPDPEIFLKAAEALSVKPERCIGVEDSDAGIDAINKAGMLSYGIGSEESLKEAYFKYGSIKDYPLEMFLCSAPKSQLI